MMTRIQTVMAALKAQTQPNVPNTTIYPA